MKIDRTHRVARLALAVRSIKKAHYQTARTQPRAFGARSHRRSHGHAACRLDLLRLRQHQGAVELIDRLEESRTDARP